MTLLLDPVEPVLPMVSTWGPWGMGGRTWWSGSAPASVTYESANRTVYIPISVPCICPIARMWWANGTTVSGGSTITAAIYNDVAGKPKDRLYTANAVQGTANTIQFVNLATAGALWPATYWLALASTLGTNTQFFALASAAGYRSLLRLQEATGTPPSTATPVETVGSPMYIFGFSPYTTAA